MGKTTHEIIDEIAGHYNCENRSLNGTDCMYNGPDGKMCAFAYMCTDPSILTEGENCDTLLRELGQNILKEEFQGHHSEFYHELQRLHDSDANWSFTGLSQEGKATVE